MIERKKYSIDTWCDTNYYRGTGQKDFVYDDDYWSPLNSEGLISKNLEDFDLKIEHRTVESGKKVFFSKKCSFPSLLLSRLMENYPNIGLTRVTKPENADYIVYDEAPIERIQLVLRTDEITLDQVEKLHDAGIIEDKLLNSAKNMSNAVSDIKYVLQVNNWTPNEIKEDVDKFLGIETNYVYMGSIVGALEEFFKAKDKLLSTRNLVEYVYTFIPPTTKEEVNTLMDYMKSKDSSTMNMVINSLQYMNLSGVMYDVVAWFKKHFYEYDFNNTVAWKYLYFVLDMTPNMIYRSYCNPFTYVSMILKNPLNTTTLDDYREMLLENIKERIENYRDIINDLKYINADFNVFLKSDENGETGTSDTAVEGSGC